MADEMVPNTAFESILETDATESIDDFVAQIKETADKLTKDGCSRGDAKLLAMRDFGESLSTTTTSARPSRQAMLRRNCFVRRAVFCHWQKLTITTVSFGCVTGKVIVARRGNRRVSVCADPPSGGTAKAIRVPSQWHGTTALRLPLYGLYANGKQRRKRNWNREFIHRANNFCVDL